LAEAKLLLFSAWLKPNYYFLVFGWSRTN